MYRPISVALISVGVCAFMSNGYAETPQTHPDITAHFADSGKNVIVAPSSVIELLQYTEPTQAPSGPRTIVQTRYRAMVYRENTNQPGARRKAENIAGRVRRSFSEYKNMVHVLSSTGTHIRVVVGAFKTKDEAERVARQICSRLNIPLSTTAYYEDRNCVIRINKTEE